LSREGMPPHWPPASFPNWSYLSAARLQSRNEKERALGLGLCGAEARPHGRNRRASRRRCVSRHGPFGRALTYALRNARLRRDGVAVWEEEDYCRPPLAEERSAVLDAYFHDLRTEIVGEGAGWKKIDTLRRSFPSSPRARTSPNAHASSRRPSRSARIGLRL
jgi:hypothetical protein